ncbi:MAG: uroporphyrinogen decarboxylase family protein [Anaerolineae bacterium]
MQTLRDIVDQSPHRLVVPLMGFPGTQLTHSTIWQNEFNAELQYRTIAALVERFEPDAAFFFMDLAVEAGAIGLPVLFPASGSPSVKQHPVKRIEDLAQFEVVDVRYDARVRTYVDVMQRMKAGLEVLAGAYVIGPFTLAGLMMGATQIALATIQDPDLVHAAARFATDVIIRYGEQLAEAGADMLCVLEPTATFISPKAFRAFSGRYVKEIVEALDIRTILHICGDTKHLVEAMCETGVQGLSLDAPLDFPATIERMPENVVLIGNVDPVRVMVNETPDNVREAVRALVENMAPYPNFILSTGCDLPPETPLANIQAFMEAGRAP